LETIFQSHIQRIEGVTDADKFDILISLLHASVYAYIRDCETYGDAMACLGNTFLKPVNEVFARHRLNICQQKVGESLEEFLQKLKTLRADCNCRGVTAAENEEAGIRDEDAALELQAVFDKARSLDDAQRNVEIYSSRSAITPGTLALCETSSETNAK